MYNICASRNRDPLWNVTAEVMTNCHLRNGFALGNTSIFFIYTRHWTGYQIVCWSFEQKIQTIQRFMLYHLWNCERYLIISRNTGNLKPFSLVSNPWVPTNWFVQHKRWGKHYCRKRKTFSIKRWPAFSCRNQIFQATCLWRVLFCCAEFSFLKSCIPGRAAAIL